MILYKFAVPELKPLAFDRQQSILDACSSSPRLRSFNKKAQNLALIPVIGLNGTGFYQMTEYQQMAAFQGSGGNVNAGVSTISSYEVNYSTAVDHFRTQMSWLNAYYENGGPGTFNSVLQTNFGPLASAVDFGNVLVTAASTVPGYAEAVGDFVANTGTILANNIGNWWSSMWTE